MCLYKRNSYVRYVSLIISCIMIPFIGISQSGWGAYQKLYSDSKITVLVSFRIKDACEQNESFKASTFKYRITGDFRNYEYYLNWKLDYIDCNGNLYYQQNSLNIGSDSKAGSGTVDNMGYSPQDVEFTCKSLENPFYEVDVSYTSKKGGGLKSLPFSKDPLGIDGEKNIYIGEASTLKVNGGILGIGAKWIWYEGECGKNSIGTGEKIEINPKQTTTYFVRAESAKNITNCVSITVNVNQLSIAPNAITGKINLCTGESTYLTISGGKLGVNAEWIWYKGDCGFNEIGRGQSLTVKPEQTTRYYARAEGKFNKTDCAEVIVTVSEMSEKASSILSSKIKCLSEPVTLTAIGGNLSKDAQWVWYNNSYGYGYPIGRGSSITITPNKEKAFCVRAEGCNVSECMSTEIIAKQISTPPITIDDYTNQKTKKLELTVTGGALGTNANWYWYKNSNYKGSPISKGSTLIVSPKKPTFYYVRAEGECNITPGLSKGVNTPYYLYRFTPTYYNKRKPSIAYKTIQIGGGLGIEFNSLFAYTSTITSTYKYRSYPYNGYTYTYDTVNQNSNITGAGIKGEFIFHPIIKDFFSIGLFTNGAVIFGGGEKTNMYNEITEKKKYLNYRFDIGAEIAAGYSKVKALAIYKTSMQTHTLTSRTALTDNYSYDNSYSTINFEKEIRRETVSIGIRTAPYSVKNERYKRGFCFDFLYHLSRDYEWDWDNAKWNYNALSGFNSGAGMAIWVQSVLKFQLDLMFRSPIGSYASENSTSVQFSLIYNRNAFY